MAKKLKSFNFENGTSSRKSKYAWDEWFDGDIWQLEQGKDFKIKPASFRISLGTNAKKRGLKLRISQVEKGFVIQAYKATPRRGRPRKKV